MEGEAAGAAVIAARSSNPATTAGSSPNVVALPLGGAAEHTLAFPPVTAKFFRVSFTTQPPPAGRAGFGGMPPMGGRAAPTAPAGVQIAELVLQTGARVNRFEEKAAFVPTPDLYGFATPAVSAQDAVRKADVIDLTSKMRPDGTLDWTPPAGTWMVVRLGYSLLGITNHPASPEATGLEVDKLNRAYVKAYLDNYLGQYKDTVGPLMGKRGLQYVVTDSWEAGAENWTDDMIAEFTKRRGYDPHPWLPVLTGHVVESAEASDRFLWDFRRTIADLIAENHYDQITASLQGARHGPLQRIARVGPGHYRGWHGSQTERRSSDERDVDPVAGRQ